MSQIKERPILFSGEMVRAILDGRKTQTRRVVKPQPSQSEYEPESLYISGRTTERQEHNGKVIAKGSPYYATTSVIEFAKRCPYGQPGDRLWVRETFASMFKDEGPVCYRATESGMHSGPWKPSIFMPRWASRITLEIVSVRVERLQDISDADAQEEGCYPDDVNPSCGAIYRFCRLWRDINGEDSWDANPWVWVVEFRRAKT